MSRGCHQRHPDGKGVTVRWGPEEARRETRGPDAQKRRRRPAPRAEGAPYPEAWVRAAQVDGAGPVEETRSYLGRPRRLAVTVADHVAGPAAATSSGRAEESAEVIVPTVEACGRRNLTLVTREAFGVGKDRTSKSRETPGSSRGRW